MALNLSMISEGIGCESFKPRAVFQPCAVISLLPSLKTHRSRSQATEPFPEVNVDVE